MKGEDMFRLLRRSASVFLVLFALAAVEARAGSSYLFGATEEDIDATMRNYFPRGYDRDAAFRQMSAPFDCRNFGDLCREVGDDYAYRMVETVWQKAKRQTPLDMIARATEQQYDDLSLRWFERLYPEGIDDRDPYWGVFAAGGQTIADTVSATSSNGQIRVTHKSRRHVILAVAWGRIQLEHYKKNVWGKFRLSKADRVEVSGAVLVTRQDEIPTFVLISDTKDDEKQVAASHGEPAISLSVIPLAEGCGTAVGSGISEICSSSGAVP
jgi:hypothetical protein